MTNREVLQVRCFLLGIYAERNVRIRDEYDGIEYRSRMFPTWRIASAKAAFQRWPRRATLGLAGWIAVLGVPAAVIGVAVAAGLPSAANELIVGVWLLLVVATVLVAGWIWVWRVSELANMETSARYDVLRDIETSRLTLRRPAPKDAISLEATIDDAMLASNGWTERNGRALIKAVGGGHPTPGLLVIESRSDATVIGGATVHPTGDETSSRSIGWWIGASHRGAGYASEAVAALVDALHDAGYTSVEIGTNESNLAVQRICDKIGATVMDRRPQPLPNGSTVPGIWFEHRRVVTETT
ncbi:GNAT family N-acetyltransferase [Nocardia amamiensis]|uniref:GNAT family N-acetyltransferase n=1 Tax=Nocardia amamiensis TaxID=404578 RepID=UPI00082DADC6|nr:GNAT family N-acetyltransferase [Nocardia amamiensis]